MFIGIIFLLQTLKVDQQCITEKTSYMYMSNYVYGTCIMCMVSVTWQRHRVMLCCFCCDLSVT